MFLEKKADGLGIRETFRRQAKWQWYKTKKAMNDETVTVKSSERIMDHFSHFSQGHRLRKWGNYLYHIRRRNTPTFDNRSLIIMITWLMGLWRLCNGGFLINIISK